MTNQQGAPEALRLADALQAVEEGWSIADKCCAELRRLHAENERLAALVEAQQPAAHVQNPAETEHVADDVSKNGLESNMTQQRAPSAAAEPDMFWDYDDPERFGHDIEDVISEYAPGDIVKIDCAKRMPTIRVRVVADGDDLTYEVIGAPQPSPTPQADSQPVPDVERLDPSQPLHVNLAHLAKSPKAAIEAFGAEWAGRCAASAIDALRAARATADSVTAPAGGAVSAPVFAFRRKGLDDFCTCTEERYAELSAKPSLFETRIFYTTPPAQAADSVLEDAALSQAARDVLAERQRQISAEGWTPEHDDEQHLPGELALAAASYVCADENDAPPAIWPWALNWWKPRDPRRNLTKAGALILAEMERIDRAARKQGGAT